MRKIIVICHDSNCCRRTSDQCIMELKNEKIPYKVFHNGMLIETLRISWRIMSIHIIDIARISSMEITEIKCVGEPQRNKNFGKVYKEIKHQIMMTKIRRGEKV